ncbi:hypothetical protein [Streptococcus suis]|uniref:hypothetical protein n=1 Tax=Streptococcus suis TaxID=1307 RepID=UPI0002B789A5|nr:hypothetical protein [Streptococcus suis]AGF87464.1 hypothetical protein phi5218_0053 [Streptococcus phage phi5218]HEM2799284.1 hypothetical protein [Streptococcus suis]HEM3209186.1 hypothetical protein [Streptococcus suis 22083]
MKVIPKLLEMYKTVEVEMKTGSGYLVKSQTEIPDFYIASELSEYHNQYVNESTVYINQDDISSARGVVDTLFVDSDV